MFTIKRCTDFNEFVQFAQLSWKVFNCKTTPIETLKENFNSESKTHAVFIALDKDQVVGGLVGSIINLPFTPQCYITAVCVHPDYRSKNIATMLMEAVQQWGINSGCHRFELSSTPCLERKAAYNLYHKLGYNSNLEKHFINKL